MFNLNKKIFNISDVLTKKNFRLSLFFSYFKTNLYQPVALLYAVEHAN